MLWCALQRTFLWMMVLHTYLYYTCNTWHFFAVSFLMLKPQNIPVLVSYPQTISTFFILGWQLFVLLIHGVKPKTTVRFAVYFLSFLYASINFWLTIMRRLSVFLLRHVGGGTWGHRATSKCTWLLGLLYTQHRINRLNIRFIIPTHLWRRRCAPKRVWLARQRRRGRRQHLF